MRWIDKKLAKSEIPTSTYSLYVVLFVSIYRPMQLFSSVGPSPVGIVLAPTEEPAGQAAGRKGLCFSRFSGTYRYGATFTPILSQIRHVKRIFCPENFLACIIPSNNDNTLTLVKLALDKDGIMAQFLLTEASIDGKECAV